MNEEQQLWQSQSEGTGPMSIDELRKRLQELERKMRARTRGGYLVCGFLVLASIWWMTLIPNAFNQIGSVLTVFGVGVLAWQIHSVRTRTNAAAESGTRASLEFYRDELRRQRDFHRGRSFWTRLLALIPGPILVLLGFHQANHNLAGMLIVEGITFALLLLAAIPLNLTLARRYQRQLDTLDLLEKERT
jgi:hypothetical protein